MKYTLTKRGKTVNGSFAICFLSLLVLIPMLIAVEPALATNIEINLGPSPALSTDLTIPFAGLNGTTLSGQNLSLDFVFSGAQFVRLFSVTTNFGILVKLQTNSPGDPGFLSGTGFISDQFGNPLQAPQGLGSASSSDGWTAAGLFPLLAGSGVPTRPFDFFAVDFALTLPSNSSFEVTGAEFRLSNLGSGGPFGIGPGVPNDIVPDRGGAIYLLGIGLGGLLIAHFKVDGAI